MLDVARLDQQMHEHLVRYRIPAIAISILHGEDTLYSGGFGTTDVEEGRPVTTRTLFRIGSLTKLLTAVAVLRLVDHGYLHLDEPIHSYVPELQFSTPALAHVVTLRMLMSHLAGLPTDWVHQGARDPDGLERHLLDDLPHYVLHSPPGMMYYYSNLGMNIAGYIASRVIKLPFTTLMQEVVFRPLGMHRTTFDPLVAMTYPLALSHRLEHDQLYVERDPVENTAHYPTGFAFSTVEDLSIFARMLLQKGEHHHQPFLSRALVAEMQTPQIPIGQGIDHHYGLPFAIGLYKDHRRMYHEGNIQNYHATFEMLPDSGLAAIVLMNRTPHEYVPFVLSSPLCEHLMVPNQSDVSGLSPPMGHFVSRQNGQIEMIATENGQVLRKQYAVSLGDAHRQCDLTETERAHSYDIDIIFVGMYQYHRVRYPESHPVSTAFGGHYKYYNTMLELMVEDNKLIASAHMFGGSLFFHAVEEHVFISETNITLQFLLENEAEVPSGFLLGQMLRFRRVYME